MIQSFDITHIKNSDPIQNPEKIASLSPLAITLLKGVIYREEDEGLWGNLLRLKNELQDYVNILGLTLIIDDAEGYAFLRSIPDSDEDAEESPKILRLIPRRALPFHVSLLLALLRQQLVRFDALGGETRLMLSRDDICSLLQTFLPDTSNEVKQISLIDSYIKRVVEMGFLKLMPEQVSKNTQGAQLYEVRRILKAYITADWLATLDERLEAYRIYAMTQEQKNTPLFVNEKRETVTETVNETFFTPQEKPDEYRD